jgi:amidohydrolase
MNEFLNTSELSMLVEMRKHLHSIAELSGNEWQTSQYIKSFIKKCNPDIVLTGVGKTGVIATWDSGTKGFEVLFRADIDALPVEETNSFDYVSENKHVSHKCGHDGHSAILIGLALLLSKNKPTQGKVHLLFQPSEENGQGAQSVLNDDRFSSLQPDFVFALHNIPGYPINTVIVKEGSFSSSVNSVIVELTGKTSHASEPEKGINPTDAVCEILQQSALLVNNDSQSDDMQLVTPIYVLVGEKSYGTTAGKAEVHLTLRCRTNQQLKALEQSIENIAQLSAIKHKLDIQVRYTETFFACENSSESVELVKNAAQRSDLHLIEMEHPFKWGEDFGLFTSRYNGAMFGLGAGVDCSPLHNSDYDFPDALISAGVSIFANIIDEIQKRKFK